MGARNDTRQRVGRLRRRATALLWAERLLGASLPTGCVLLAYLALAAFGYAGPWVFTAALLAGVMLLAFGAWRVSPPNAAEADRRIETASALGHRPLAAVEDRLALGDPSLFASHQARMGAALAGARTGGLAPVAAGADPFSLRAAAALLLIVGLLVAGAAAPQRLARAFTLPDWPFPGPLVQAWITPPSYTGQPPFLLKPGAPVTVLVGARVGVVLSGSTDDSRFAGAILPGPRPADDSRRVEGGIDRSGRLTVGPWWHRLAAWDIKAVPPSAPVLTLHPPRLQADDLALAFNAADAYGLSSLAVALSPVGHPGALAAGAELPAQTGAGQAVLNEADSPYAGLPVSVNLKADNLAGITAVTPPQTVRLPAAPHQDPTAAALAMIRQRLALDPDATAPAGAALAALSRMPPSAITYAADLQMAALAAELSASEARAAPAVDRMAALVHQLDAGRSYAADQALAAAAQALTDTLRQGGTQAQLNAALRKLEQALAQKLSAGGQGAASSGGSASGGRSLEAGDLQRMAEQIAADERAGNMAKAQQDMAQLQQTLQQLQQARVMTPQEQKRAAAAGAAQGQLGQLIQGQGQQLDRTGQGTATPAAQGQLRQALNGLQHGLAKAGLPGTPGLDQAGQAMDQAQQALSDGDNEAAARAESEAITRMQQAAATLKDQAGTSIGFGGTGPADQGDANGSGEDQAIPGLDLEQTSPARRIQQEIMHRDADPALAPGTHDYLHRLLNP